MAAITAKIKKVPVGLSLDPRTKVRLKFFAKQYKVSSSAVIQSLIEDWLATEQKKFDKQGINEDQGRLDI